jgi:hypothetical protein
VSRKDDPFEPTQMPAALVQKQMVVAEKRAQVRTRIAKLHETDLVLRLRYIDLENAIHEAKNLGFLRSWMALREAIANSSDPRELPHHMVVRAVK